MNPLHIALVEDNSAIAANIIDYFSDRGHVVDYASRGNTGLEMVLEKVPDVLILDLALPGMDGWDVIRGLREHSPTHIPVLMLTARDSLEDKVTGFELGTDDYLTKPFALEELMMRCQALSRRYRLHDAEELVIGTLTIDRRSREVKRNGQSLALNATCYQLLLHLAEAAPGVVTRSELTLKIWGDDPPDSDSLRSHIYQLRRILDKPYAHAMIKTVHGAGFSLQAEKQ